MSQSFVLGTTNWMKLELDDFCCCLDMTVMYVTVTPVRYLTAASRELRMRHRYSS